MREGRSDSGRFLTGPSPDRGRGRPPASAPAFGEELRQVAMATANLPVSIPRGRGRRVVTLYEALLRMISGGKVYRRAAVMDFIRLVQEAAAGSPEPEATIPAPLPASIVRVQGHLDRLRSVAESAGATPLDQSAVTFTELLLELVQARAR